MWPLSPVPLRRSSRSAPWTDAEAARVLAAADASGLSLHRFAAVRADPAAGFAGGRGVEFGTSGQGPDRPRFRRDIESRLIRYAHHGVPWHKTATGLKFLRSLPMRTEQVEALLADIIKRVTLQAERFYARRADADGTLKPGDPALAALLQGSLFGPQELQRAEPATGKAGLPSFQTKSRNCVDSRGFNLHANTAVHELARDRLEHLVPPHSLRDIESRLARCAHRGVPSSAGQPSRPNGSWRLGRTMC